ncbi:uncharacterized protein LOC133183886 [Saccostrea echinata]|uniref:uncharacterized protein LOC133183886 n=1 Tax=Saccostrea echinata TaxID=191078 RepID=UPI002A81F60D|nr:uncharacterized protein LOC133183886 [Saccostrea echinata]
MSSPETRDLCYNNGFLLNGEELGEIEKSIVQDLNFEENNFTFTKIKYTEEKIDHEQKKCIWRLNTLERIQCEEMFRSEVRVENMDTGRGVSLGGFICSTKRKDGSYLHRFEDIDQRGVLFKSFSIRDGDVIVSLNFKDVSVLPPVSHAEVTEYFQKVSLDKSSTMMICRCRPRSEKYTYFKLKFCMKNILKDWSEETDVCVKIIVKEPTDSPYQLVTALRIANACQYLINNGGRLGLAILDNFKKRQSGHFVRHRSIKFQNLSFFNVYSYQSVTDSSKFLGLASDGKTIDLVEGKYDDERVSFRNYKCQASGSILRPYTQPDKAVFFIEGSLQLADFRSYFSGTISHLAGLRELDI